MWGYRHGLPFTKSVQATTICSTFLLKDQARATNILSTWGRQLPRTTILEIFLPVKGSHLTSFIWAWICFPYYCTSTSTTITECLIYRHGVPKDIVSDHGIPSTVMEKAMKQLLVLSCIPLSESNWTYRTL